MMRNPYEILGLPDGAPIEEVKSAYKQLAGRYQADGSPESNRMMDEINAAYDSIVMGTGSSHQGNTYTGFKSTSDYSDIASKIRAGRLEDATILLDGIPEESREAQWYFLKGTVFQKSGWLEEAARHYETAHNLDPENKTYKAAFDRVTNARSGGYRTARRQSRTGKNSTCTATNCCCSLLCADACCECFGGDIIPCC